MYLKCQYLMYLGLFMSLEAKALTGKEGFLSRPLRCWKNTPNYGEPLDFDALPCDDTLKPKFSINSTNQTLFLNHSLVHQLAKNCLKQYKRKSVLIHSIQYEDDNSAPRCSCVKRTQILYLNLEREECRRRRQCLFIEKKPGTPTWKCASLDNACINQNEEIVQAYYYNKTNCRANFTRHDEYTTPDQTLEDTKPTKKEEKPINGCWRKLESEGKEEYKVARSKAECNKYKEDGVTIKSNWILTNLNENDELKNFTAECEKLHGSDALIYNSVVPISAKNICHCSTYSRFRGNKFECARLHSLNEKECKAKGAGYGEAHFLGKIWYCNSWTWPCRERVEDIIDIYDISMENCLKEIEEFFNPGPFNGEVVETDHLINMARYY